MRLLLIPFLTILICLPQGLTQGVAQAQEATSTAEQRTFGLQLAAAAMKSAGADITYNGAYVGLTYPWGDVPQTQGVCSDVVIRAYIALGVSLQKRVHEDMRDHFATYPTKWGLRRPDKNIDHRRVLNLEVFFERNGQKLPISQMYTDYLPGDIVAYNVPATNGTMVPHIGVVTAVKNAAGEPLVVHHLSGQPLLEDVLFAWPMTGHYRYFVPESERDR